MNGIDLFSGCGGLSWGFLDAGFRVVAGLDNDAPSIATYNFNLTHRGAQGHALDISTASGDEILSLTGLPKIDFVLGGPPCQAFSIAGKQRGRQDARGKLVFDFVRLVRELNPSFAVLENVPNALNIEGGRLFAEVLAELSAAGYDVAYKCLYAPDYGVPQMRKRVFVVASKHGTVVMPPPPSHSASQQSSLLDDVQPYVTVSDALVGLAVPTQEPIPGLFNHEPTYHSETTVERFKDLRPGQRDRKTFQDRLDAAKPAYTLRAGSGNFSPLKPIHYEEHRVVTVRESARIQTFPDHFVWPDYVPKVQQYRQVGNAVPPKLAEAVARHIAGSLGCRLNPAELVGDFASRPSPLHFSADEKERRARLKIRGASLNSAPSAGTPADRLAAAQGTSGEAGTQGAMGPT